MTLLTREQILASKPQTVTVDVPEMGDDAQVTVSEMSGIAREEYERVIFDSKGKLVSDKSLRACLVACTAVDEAGEMLFSAQDVHALGRTSAQALNRIYEAAMRLNGMGPDATKRAAKNS